MDISHPDLVNNRIVHLGLHTQKTDLAEMSISYSFCLISTVFANSLGRRMLLSAEREEAWCYRTTSI